VSAPPVHGRDPARSAGSRKHSSASASQIGSGARTLAALPPGETAGRVRVAPSDDDGGNEIRRTVGAIGG
jgi:hypothetical protein